MPCTSYIQYYNSSKGVCVVVGHGWTWLDMASKLGRAVCRASGYSELSISHCEVVGPGSQLLRCWFHIQLARVRDNMQLFSLGWCKLKEVEQVYEMRGEGFSSRYEDYEA